MIFISKTRDQRITRELETFREWHKKFAWIPIRMTDTPDVVVWLEFVLRKGSPRQFSPKILWDWKYTESILEVLKHGE